ncbi:MAG: Arm DNA-binding domain-containing protein [Bacteroidales bacterium]|nr:Arm DNA-binding domain-containing protein [Bacteroidales bacterium]
MKSMQKSTFSLLFIIKKSKLRKNGEAPICLRVTVNRHIEEIMIKRHCPVESSLKNERIKNSYMKVLFVILYNCPICILIRHSINRFC